MTFKVWLVRIFKYFDGQHTGEKTDGDITKEEWITGFATFIKGETIIFIIKGVHHIHQHQGGAFIKGDPSYSSSPLCNTHKWWPSHALSPRGKVHRGLLPSYPKSKMWNIPLKILARCKVPVSWMSVNGQLLATLVALHLTPVSPRHK